MVKYILMKRITQIFGSILFIITVLTIYLAFDFAISNALPKRYSTDNTIQKPSSILSLLKNNKSDQILKSNLNEQERRTRSIKPKRHPGKLAQFHKSKTGIKINQIKKSAKESRKRLSSTKIPQNKNIKTNPDKLRI